MKNISKSFYYIRHGQTDWNKNNICQGHIDIPLNSVGLNQANLAKSKVENLNLKAVISSPLIRAFKTAQIINSNRKFPLTTHRGLMECHSEKVATEYMLKSGHENLPDFSKLGEKQETKAEFVERVKDSLIEITKRHERDFLIVSHGGVGQCISEFLNIDYVKIPNCQIIRFFLENNKYKLELI